MKRNQWTIYVLALIVLLGLMTGCGAKTETGDGEAAKPQVQEDQDQEMGKLLCKQFVDMMKGGEYLMKYRTTMDVEGQAIEMEATVAVSGENTAMISTTNGMESTMVMKDGKNYIIDHDSKTIMVLPEAPDASTDKSTGIVNVDSDIKYLDTGKEGNLTYEEYAITDGTIRYYFDGDKLIKMVVNSNDQVMTMDILELDNKVPDGIFDIPTDYQLIAM